MYIRADGETRKANGLELASIIGRAAAAPTSVDVAVEVLGAVHALTVDVDRLVNAIDERATTLRIQVEPKPRGPYDHILRPPTLNFSMETRTKTQFLDEVERWRAEGHQDPTRGVRDMAGVMLDGIRIRVENLSQSFLENVRLDLHLDQDVTAVEWETSGHAEYVDILGEAPPAWGSATLLTAGLGGGNRPIGPIHLPDVHVSQENPLLLTYSLGSLRPEDAPVSDSDAIVLIAFGDSGREEAVTGHWRLTATGIHDVFEGAFSVPVRHLDWRELVEQLLAGPVDVVEE